MGDKERVRKIWMREREYRNWEFRVEACHGDTCLSLIPALGNAEIKDLWDWGQPVLHSKFQDSQDYIERRCLKTKNQTKSNQQKIKVGWLWVREKKGKFSVSGTDFYICVCVWKSHSITYPPNLVCFVVIVYLSIPWMLPI